MSIYTYPESKVIDEVTFRKAANGGIRAYMHASPQADAASIDELRQALNQKQFSTIPSVLDNKPALEIRGFKSETQLLGFLSRQSWTKNPPAVIQEKSDHIGWGEWLKKRTLQLTGLTYLVGDYGFMKYGYKEADRLVMAGAFSYFLGTLSLIFYGRNDQSDLQVKLLADDMKQHLASENILLPENSALHEITKEKKKSFIQSAHEFCKRYPSEIFNSVTALAGVFVASSAYKNKVRFKGTTGMDPKTIREMHHEGWMDVGLGVTTAVSGILATVVKEKKHDPDEPPAKGLAWVWEKIREHPLAIAGAGYTAATMCHAASTWKRYREAKRVGDQKSLASVPFRALFVGMAFISEFLLAVSSKGHGEGVVSDTSVDNSAIALAADLIVKQPKKEQDNLIESMGRFLGGKNELALKDKNVTETLRTQVEAMRKNPWAQAGMPEKQPEAKAPPAVTPAKAAVPAWQAKVARPAETPAMQLGA